MRATHTVNHELNYRYPRSDIGCARFGSCVALARPTARSKGVRLSTYTLTVMVSTQTASIPALSASHKGQEQRYCFVFQLLTCHLVKRFYLAMTFTRPNFSLGLLMTYPMFLMLFWATCSNPIRPCNSSICYGTPGNDAIVYILLVFYYNDPIPKNVSLNTFSFLDIVPYRKWHQSFKIKEYWIPDFHSNFTH